MKKVIFIKTYQNKSTYFDAILSKDEVSQKDKVKFVEEGIEKEIYLENFTTREIGGINMIFSSGAINN